MEVGITAGAFDLFHAGHVMMLKEANEMCDHLIVALHTNPQLDRDDKNKPIQSTYERYLQLEACKYVDEIIPYDTEADLYTIFNSKIASIRIIGEEYIDTNFTGCFIPMKIHYNSRKHKYSSTELRERIINESV